ncbi:MAG: hypothetical protein ACRC6K_08090 [Fusobacteriaceae bacterium]
MEIITIIRKNILIFITIFLFCVLGGVIKILKNPLLYEYSGFFRYSGINPNVVIEKKDINGTITLKKYEIGEDNLDIKTLFKSTEYKKIAEENEVILAYDNGNGNYEIIIKGENPDKIKYLLEVYFKKIRENNLEFLEKKIKNEKNIEIKNKILYEIENDERSFPLMIKGDEVKKIDRKNLITIILSGIIGLLLGIIGVFMKNIIKRGK